LDGVRAAVAHYEDMVELNGEPGYVSAFSDVSVVPDMFSLTPTAGAINAINDGQLIIDSETATARGLQVGSTVTVEMARGEPVTLTVSGIYAASDLVGGFLVPMSLAENFYTPLPQNGFVQVDPGTSVDAIKSQVDALLADSPEITVGDRAEYLAQQGAEADQLLVMVQILLALAILIAVLGVVNTLALSVLERTREIGLLRAVGLGRAQAMRMITVEAIVISVFGAALGLAVGTGLGAAVVRALRDEGITVLALPWEQMATYLGLAALVGVVAAVLPAIRAARINVLRAIAYE
jgi:putative ABC transport system permease protein